MDEQICLDDSHYKKFMEQKIPHIQTVGHQNKRVTYFVPLYDCGVYHNCCL